MRGEARKGFDADLFEELRFIFEVKINGCGGIFDLVRNTTHGDIFVAFLNEKLAGSVEDFLAEEFLLAELAFSETHNLLNDVKLSQAFCQDSQI